MPAYAKHARSSAACRSGGAVLTRSSSALLACTRGVQCLRPLASPRPAIQQAAGHERARCAERRGTRLLEHELLRLHARDAQAAQDAQQRVDVWVLHRPAPLDVREHGRHVAALAQLRHDVRAPVRAHQRQVLLLHRFLHAAELQARAEPRAAALWRVRSTALGLPRYSGG